MVIDDLFLKAISWTLLHSIWQGFLLAFVAGLVILLTRKSASSLRYNLLTGLFAGFLILSAMTFRYELQNQNSETVTRLNLPVQQLSATFGDSVTAAIPTGYSEIIIEFFNKNSSLIVLIWFLIFSIRCFGIFANLSHIYRIRNYKTQTPSDFWIEKIAELAQKINLRNSIVLLESRLVKVPSVTGFLKPVILIPIGLLSNLPQDQVEAILLHELAHIKRKDYFINLLQSVAEIVFFFNPGVLWLSSILRDERENCCDDIAISVSESKSKFVSALVSFEEYNLKNNQLALGFGGNKNHLLNRAKRIIYDDNKTLNQIEKMVLALIFVALTTVTIACSNVAIQDKTSALSNLQLKADREAQSANTVANAAVAKADLSTFEADLEADKATLSAERASVTAEKADRIAAVATASAEEAELQVKNADEKARKADAIAKQTDLNVQKISNTRSKSVRTVTSTTEDGNSVEIRKTVHESDSNKRYNSVSVTGITGKDLSSNINSEALTQQIISDLIAEKIISDTKNLSYKLSNNSFIVNGVAQSEVKFRKVFKKYIQSDSYSIVYNYKISDKN